MAQKVLLFTSALTDALNEIRAAGGSITQQLSDRIFAAIIPDDFNTDDLKLSSVQKPKDLDENSASLVEKYNLTSSQSIPTSLYMVGTVAVGIIIVSGHEESLRFTNDEVNKIQDSVYDALTFLKGACPGNLDFTKVVYNISIDAPPSGSCVQETDYNKCLDIFRKPALESLGYCPEGTCDGASECEALTSDLQSDLSTNWAYIAFFTKYPVKYPYQADATGIYIQYNKSTSGNLKTIFAQESCNMFGAAYEYKLNNVDCNCNKCGYFNVPNNNCANCSYTPKVKCTMKNNPDVICDWTRGQIGWGYWNLPFVPVNTEITETTNSASGLAYKDRNLYFAWRDEGNNISIGCEYQSNSCQVLGKAGTSSGKFTTSAAPTLTSYGDYLYLAWRDGTTMSVAKSIDGIIWEKYYTYISGLNERTDISDTLAPALTVYFDNTEHRDIFVLAWVNKEFIINISYSEDLMNWNHSSTGFYTFVTPGLAFFNDKLYLAYSIFTPGVKYKLYIGRGSIGGGWETITKTKETTKVPPGLTVLESQVYPPQDVTSYYTKLCLAYANTSGKIFYTFIDHEDNLKDFKLIDGITTKKGIAMADTTVDTTGCLTMGIVSGSSNNEIYQGNFFSNAAC